MTMRVALVLLLCCCCNPVASAQEIEAGALAVRPADERGVGIFVNDLPVSRASSLQLYADGWKRGYYSSNGGARVERRREGDAIVLTHHAPKLNFVAKETVRPAGENRVEITLQGKLDDPDITDARVEWAPAYLNAATLYGGSVSAADSDATYPILPEPSARRHPVALLSGATDVRLTSRLGRIEFRVEQGPAALALLDGRRAPDRSWAQRHHRPTLWLGMTGIPITPGEPFAIRISVQVTPERRKQTDESPVGSMAATVTRQLDAFVPPTRPVLIIPRPKKLHWLSDEPAYRGDMDAADVKIDRTMLKPESYAISVRSDGIAIRAADDAGARYARQTLAQMVQLDRGGPFVAAAEIEDHPSLAFRGVHLFTGRDSVEFYRKLVENLLARFKLNHVVLESSYTEWDTDPEIWIKQSVPKVQVAHYVQISRQNGLEIVPLVQSLGHMEWMFKNGANRDLAEDPQHPYAYSVTNPKTYDFIHGVYREALELFDPKIFHIGHDEVAMRGRYPHRAEAKELGETELFLRDLQKHEALFDKHGVRMMLWGDMLLAKEESSDQAANAPSVEEAKRRRAAIPSNAIVADWHYTPQPKPQDYRSLKIFQEAGLRTIACTWSNPQNIYSFAAAARQHDAWGLLQTTWAGYHLTEATLGREMQQFEAYILAAEYAWNAGEAPPPEQLPYRTEEVLAAAMDPRPRESEPRAGATIELAGGNATLADWLGLRGVDLSDAPRSRPAGVRFHHRDEPRAIVLTGNLLRDQFGPSRKVTITPKQTFLADELAFLHCTALRAAAGAEVGRYEIAYADGMRQRIPLRYGQEVRAWDDLGAAAAHARDGWFGQTANGTPVGVRVLRWRNPAPQKPIESITFATEHDYASPALLGVTALSGASLTNPR